MTIKVKPSRVETVTLEAENSAMLYARRSMPNAFLVGLTPGFEDWWHFDAAACREAQKFFKLLENELNREKLENDDE